LIDGDGLPLTGTTTKASAHDTQSALKTIDALRIGQRLRRPKRLGADKGYDSIPLRKQLKRRGIKTAIRHRQYQNRKANPRLWNDVRETRYARNRWKVEQRIACLDQNRRLGFLYERTRETYEVFLTIARIRCYVKVLGKLRIKSRVFR
jgi:IS5 family transposase